MSYPADVSRIPSAATVAARHRDLAGLAVALDADRRAALLTPLLGSHGAAGSRIERLRLKAGTSLTAALRVPVPRGAEQTRWWRLRAFTAETWENKSAKEEHAAHRAGRPALMDPELRVSVVPAETDRRLPLLAGLYPDTGALVRLPGDAARLGPRRLRTLSYNPDRRWVGVAHDPEDRPGELLRLYAGAEEIEVRPWTPGRPWRGTDCADEALTAQVVPALAAGLEAGTRRLERQGAVLPEHPGASAPLRGTVSSLTDVDPDLAQRAQFLVEQLTPRLAEVPLAPAHGDFTTDQVVVADGRPGLLDWDHAGRWPAGWDAATWEAGQVRDGARAADVQPLPGAPRPDAAVRAAALLAYAPDPFRRQLPDWGATTVDLVTAAEEALA